MCLKEIEDVFRSMDCCRAGLSTTENVYIFGPPGSWKSALLWAIIKLCSGTSFRTQLLCPTIALTEAYRLASAQRTVDKYDGGTMMRAKSSVPLPRIVLNYSVIMVDDI